MAKEITRYMRAFCTLEGAAITVKDLTCQANFYLPPAVRNL